MSTDRQLLLARAAQIRPRTDDELYEYLKFFWGISFPRVCNPQCKGKCTALFKVLADAYFARYPMIILKGARGSGKATALDCPVLTPSGYKPMRDIHVGDVVIDEFGNFVNVIGEYPQGIRETYKVTFNDGTFTIVDGDHLWKVRPGGKKRKGFNKGHYKDWKIKTTNEIKEDLFIGLNKLSLKWRIPVVESIKFTTKNYLIDPWVLGALLGDGSMVQGTPRFTCGIKDQQFMIGKLSKGLLSLNVSVNPCISAKNTDFYISRKAPDVKNNLKEALKELDLLGKNSHTKFIPDIYKFGSVEQRLALLQGLMDTDGHPCKRSGVDFVTASKQLAEDVVFLVQSLGGTAIRSVKTIKNNTYYRLRIKMMQCPFSLPRKIEKWTKPVKYPVIRIITDITYNGLAETKCIRVDGPTSTFLLNDCIVTHNSVLLGTLALTEQVSMGAEVMILGGSSTQAKKVFEYISQKNTRFEGMFWQSENAPKALQDIKSELQESSKIITGGVIKCMPASQTSIYGQRPSRLRIDEADVCDLELIDGAIPCAHPVHKKDIKEQILISSTHYNVEGTLTTLIERAEETNKRHRMECIQKGLPDPGPNCVIPVYEVCYKDALSDIGGYLTSDQLARMKSMVSPEVWRRQFENGEPSVDGAVFSGDDLDFVFDASLGDQISGDPGTHWTIDFEKIQNKEFECYFHGVDWGLQIDSTVISTFACASKETDPDIMVSWVRPIKEIGITGHVHVYDSILGKYPGPGAHDGTGMSMFASELLQNPSHAVPWQQKKVVLEALNKFVAAVQQRKVKMPRIKFLERQLRGLTYEEAYGNKHMPDCVASLVMAWYARDRVLRNFNISGGLF